MRRRRQPRPTTTACSTRSAAAASWPTPARRSIIDAEGQPWVVGEFPLKEFKPGEWHDFRVLVEATTISTGSTAIPTVDVIDLDEKSRTLEGVLGVQVHVGPPMKIQYRDFFLKHLPDDLPIITPEQAKIPASAVKVVPQGQPKKK